MNNLPNEKIEWKTQVAEIEALFCLLLDDAKNFVAKNQKTQINICFVSKNISSYLWNIQHAVNIRYNAIRFRYQTDNFIHDPCHVLTIISQWFLVVKFADFSVVAKWLTFEISFCVPVKVDDDVDFYFVWYLANHGGNWT